MQHFHATMWLQIASQTPQAVYLYGIGQIDSIPCGAMAPLAEAKIKIFRNYDVG